MEREKMLVAQMEPQDAHGVREMIVAEAKKENKIKRGRPPVAEK